MALLKPARENGGIQRMFSDVFCNLSVIIHNWHEEWVIRWIKRYILGISWGHWIVGDWIWVGVARENTSVLLNDNSKFLDHLDRNQPRKIGVCVFHDPAQ